MRKEHKVKDHITEHYLIPAGLTLLLVNLVHLIFVLSATGIFPLFIKLSLTATFALLTIAVLGKWRWGIIAGALGYVVVLLV